MMSSSSRTASSLRKYPPDSSHRTTVTEPANRAAAARSRVDLADTPRLDRNRPFDRRSGELGEQAEQRLALVLGQWLQHEALNAIVGPCTLGPGGDVSVVMDLPHAATNVALRESHHKVHPRAVDRLSMRTTRLLFAPLSFSACCSTIGGVRSGYLCCRP